MKILHTIPNGMVIPKIIERVEGPSIGSGVGPGGTGGMGSGGMTPLLGLRV